MKSFKGITHFLQNSVLCWCTLLWPVFCYSECWSQHNVSNEQQLAQSTGGRTLVIYYSRTGKTRIIADAIARELNGKVLEITEPHSDRSGARGFFSAAYDAIFDQHREIYPRKIDLDPYDTVIIATPLWSWNLALPMHTLLQTHYFGHQKLVLVTTANIDIKKYDRFKDGSGTAVQNFLQRYLEGKRQKARHEIMAATANELEQFQGHFHIATQGKTDDQLRSEGSTIATKIQTMLWAKSLSAAGAQ